MRYLKQHMPSLLKSNLLNRRAKLERWYDGISHHYGLDRIVGYWQRSRDLTPSCISVTDWEYSGSLVDIQFLIGTSHAGLLLYDHGELYQLFDFLGVYGLCWFDGEWFVFAKTKQYGCLFSFKLINNSCQDVRLRLWGLSRGIHQIDFIGSNIFLVDTYHNRVLQYENIQQRNSSYWGNGVKIWYPNGRLLQARQSQNYNHFNSIYHLDGYTYLVAHNETLKTGKRSECYRLNEEWEVVDVQPIDGSNCHNIYRDAEHQLICRSIEGTIEDNGDVVLDVGRFTRGISVAEDYYLFGGSTFQKQREERGLGAGYVYITDKEFNQVATLTIPQTQIQEIRRVDQLDWALSNVKV